MTDKEIQDTYDLVKKYHEDHLKLHGVQLPRLKPGKKYTKYALTLVYLAQGYPNTKVVTKNQLTSFLSTYFDDINDVQQARHLAAQKGFYILSGTRGDAEEKLKNGEYKLKTLEMPYPGFTAEKRESNLTDDEWESLKKEYGYRCACCGSKEGEHHLLWPATITKLQKGHMNPSKPLVKGNVIPQCSKCNQPDKNYWVYDAKGRVIKIANPSVVEKSSAEVQKQIYEILKRKFDK